MKRILLSLLLLFSTGLCGVVAQEGFDPGRFWSNARAESKEYGKYYHDQGQYKMKCRDEFYGQVRQEYRTLSQIPVDTLERFLLPRVNALFVGEEFPLRRLIVVDDAYSNACITPAGVVLVTLPLVQMLTAEELLGVIAHEVAHYRLLHTEINFYAQRRKRRNNEIWAGVLTGLYTGANMTGPMLAASGGISTSQAGMERIVYDHVVMGYAFMEAFGKNAGNWGYRYAREQELEADFIAAQLMDSVGIGRDRLIAAFGKLRKEGIERGENPAITYKDSDHPGWDERILAVRDFPTWSAYRKHLRRLRLARDPFYD